MGLYRRYILPTAIHLACSTRPLMRQRQKVVPLARGRVLEIGIGSGLNLPFYDAGKVSMLWGLDPAAEMTRRAAKAAQDSPFPIEIIGLPGEEIPLDNASIDTIVMTYTLCSIADPRAALRQMARVLKPGGLLLFCEHGAAPDPGVRRWQERIDPLWQKLSGGCHLGRAIPALIEQGGFRVDGLQARYIPGWRPASYNFWGSATLK